MKKWYAGGAIGLAMLAASGLVISKQLKPQSEKPQASLQEFTSQEVGIKLKYSSELQSGQLSDQDKADNFILRLSDTSPATLVTVRYENGIKAVATISKQYPVDMLMANAKLAYPQRFTGFKVISERQFDHRGRPAGEIVYSYEGPSGRLAQQRLMIVMASDDRAIYLSGQTTADDFQQVNTGVFDQLFSSVEL